jgi:uncharacterized membrane protein
MMPGLLTPESLIDGFLVGLICGAVPLYVGAVRNRLRLGFSGLIACILGGLLLGLPLAIAVGGFVVWRIYRAHNAQPIDEDTQARNRHRVITVLALLGIGVAGYLTWIHYSGVAIFCGGSNTCELVNSSRYAFIGPFPGIGLDQIPVAMLGLGAYILMLALSLFPPREDRQWPDQLLFALALIGTLFQLYLTYIELFVLHAICYWCVSSQTIILLIFLLALPRRSRTVEAVEV